MASISNLTSFNEDPRQDEKWRLLECVSAYAAAKSMWKSKFEADPVIQYLDNAVLRVAKDTAKINLAYVVDELIQLLLNDATLDDQAMFDGLRKTVFDCCQSKNVFSMIDGAASTFNISRRDVETGSAAWLALDLYEEFDRILAEQRNPLETLFYDPIGESGSRRIESSGVTVRVADAGYFKSIQKYSEETGKNLVHFVKESTKNYIAGMDRITAIGDDATKLGVTIKAKVSVSVSDIFGAELPNEESKKVFEEFYKRREEAKDRKNLGLECRKNAEDVMKDILRYNHSANVVFELHETYEGICFK